MTPRVILLLLSLSLPAVAGTFTVAIDPGHGGVHDGALGPKGVKEKEVTLAVARELKSLLEEDATVKVVLTRDDDLDIALHERTQVANHAKADLLVSIHCNSMPTKSSRKETSGIETYVLSADASDASASETAARENADVPQEGPASPVDPISMILTDLSRTQAHADASLLAEKVHKGVVKAAKSKDRRVRQAPFLVLMGADMPAVLVEIGFISHPGEGKKLSDPEHQKTIATALRDAIQDFRGTIHERRVAGGDKPAPAAPATTDPAVATDPVAAVPAVAPVPAVPNP